MVRDDDQLERLQKRSFDILSVATERLVRAFAYEEKRETSTEAHASVKDKKRERTRTTMRSSSGKRLKKIDECENQDPKQNPNGDASSPSLCHAESKRRGQVVSNQTVRRRKEPVREREAVQERERTPEWLVSVMREKNGVDAKLIFVKALTMSDVAKGQTRLLIPWNQILDMDFLNENELEIIDEHYRKIRNKGLDVNLVDSRGRKWELNLRRWDMRSCSYYTLATGWNKVVACNSLEINHNLQLWSFRSLDGLFFALVPPDPAPALSLVPDPAPSSPPAPVTRDISGLDLLVEVCEETTRLEALQEANRRGSLVPVTRDFSSLDLLVEACNEMFHLEVVQEANRRSSLISVTNRNSSLGCN